MVLIGGCAMGLGFLAFYLMPVAWLAAPLALATGFGTYLMHNTLQTHGSQMAPATRGSAMALFAFCFFLGQAGGVSAAGWAYDHVGAALLLLVPATALPLAGWNFARGLRRREAA
jgi:predicted MFS family arabinose efflux permease